MPVMESSRTCLWPRGSSRTISIVLCLGLGLGLVDKVVRMLSDLVMLKCNKHIPGTRLTTIDSFRYCFLGLLVLTLNSVKCSWF